MRRSLWITVVLLAAVGAFGESARASQLVESRFDVKLVPGPVEYNVLLPDGYGSAKEPLPLLLFLHGGGSDRTFLTRLRATIDDLWNAGTLPKMVVVTPSAGRSFYMDYKDGSQKWESFIVGPFLEHLRQTLWDFKIPHEYHLVRGADHVGRTIRPRTTEALGFLARVLNPPAADAEADAL